MHYYWILLEMFYIHLNLDLIDIEVAENKIKIFLYLLVKIDSMKLDIIYDV
jgi:hypothetical protein